ncbi:hypothetical protein GH714_043840 [Hevea brasiliensis]|uniref:J domain-containing protein n=1 Tax=Hevea brasiliensis TaxID=3981 RepID=A0A6A6K2I6_HEVBR|nr:hypothetical protein GH714_043840 [Hevea brasiliensis]
MDGNKDDALKCLKIGKDALQSGDPTRALKFINKASRLDPTLPGRSLIVNREDSSSDQTAASTNGPTSTTTNESKVRHRVPSTGSSSSASATASSSSATCSKAYRKLSLKVHPDKNKAPGAEETFKAVSKAFQCLSNEESRKKPIYSLSRSYPYEYRFTTQKGVNFYVKNTKFEHDYPPGSQERATLEGKVERDYMSTLAQNCRFELQRQQWGFIRETPHC